MYNIRETLGAIKNGQSWETGNIWVHKTEDEDKKNQKKTHKKTTQHKTPDTRRRQTQISPHEAFLGQPLVGTVKIKRLEIQIIYHFIFCCHGHCWQRSKGNSLLTTTFLLTACVHASSNKNSMACVHASSNKVYESYIHDRLFTTQFVICSGFSCRAQWVR